jgi:hypothetical protein
MEEFALPLTPGGVQPGLAAGPLIQGPRVCRSTRRLMQQVLG